MQLSNFSGGMNTRVDPSLLDTKEGVKFCNIDNTSKILKSISDVLIVPSITIFGYFHNFSDTWLSSELQRSYVEYKNAMYWTEEGKIPQKFNGSSTFKMGINAPQSTIYLSEQEPLVAPVSTPTLVETAPAGSGISADAEALTYCYTYYDSVQNRESDKSASSIEISLSASKDVTVSNIVASVETGVDKIRVYRLGDGITTMTLVKEVPNSSSSVIDSKTTEELSPFKELGDLGLSGDSEVLQYTYTYYNSQGDVESVNSPLSAEINLPANKEVLVSNIKASDDIQVDKIRLYRTGDGSVTFTLIDEYPNQDNSFIDATSSIDIDGRLFDSSTNYPPPEDGRYLTEAYGIMFMAVGSDIHFSAKGKPDYFPVTNVISFANDITGMFPVPNGILIFSKTRTDILIGTEGGNFSVLPISSEHGSVSHYSGKLVKNIPTWVSLDGICNYSSGVIKVVSKDKLGKTTLDVVNSTVYDEIYWLCLSDGTLLAMDTRFGGLTFKTFKYLTNIDNILTYDNILYGRQGDKLVKLLEGVTNLAMDYVSPVLTEGENSHTKLYNNVYIKSDSDTGLTLYILIDGTQVHQKLLLGKGVFDVTPPAEKQRGSNIQFGVKGIGKLYEIGYKVLGRSNGR